MTKLKLMVEDALHFEDHTTIAMCQSNMNELSLFPGDVVLLKGKKTKSTLATVQPDESALSSQILMNKVVRSNLRFALFRHNPSSSLTYCAEF